MVKIRLVVKCLLVIGVISGCASNINQSSGGFEQKPTPPAAFASKINPLSGQADAATAGKAIYQANYVTCHGENGTGDGPSAPALNPKPADLSKMSPAADSDAYIFWRISEGGDFPPFNSAMPAWKSILNEKQIWLVVSYLRTIEK